MQDPIKFRARNRIVVYHVSIILSTCTPCMTAFSLDTSHRNTSHRHYTYFCFTLQPKVVTCVAHHTSNSLSFYLNTDLRGSCSIVVASSVSTDYISSEMCSPAVPAGHAEPEPSASAGHALAPVVPALARRKPGLLS
jgi:hypothetical protein